ncbi:MAG: 30S ribosomal protein S4 [Sedimentisphaerales bacterium]|nr:30S ribosomal protein S4 [Sedimentisphaerales bacterium]
MGNYTGPKVKLSRRLGVPIAETVRHMSLKRPNRPGMHGFRSPRRSLYGRQLNEKQRLAFYYNVRDRQMRKYVKMASVGHGSAAAALRQILESRLDNVVRRLGWVRTIWQARQMVAHGHILVNGNKVDIPSYLVKAEDTISVKDKSSKFVQTCSETCEEKLVPTWLVCEDGKLQGKVLNLPSVEEIRIPFELDYSLIIEYFTH